jgi:hypothetical protein
MDRIGVFLRLFLYSVTHRMRMTNLVCLTTRDTMGFGLAYAAVRTSPMPDRFLKMAEAWGSDDSPSFFLK